jgi:antitoxin MazE
MSAAIITRIVKIGNSQGIRIPKVLLEQSGLHGEVKIEVQGDKLTISKATRSRQGWNEAFANMTIDADEDRLLDEEIATDWEQDEWEW